MNQDLCLMPAVQLARLIREREVSAVEVIRAHLDRISDVNPALNAIVTLDADAAMCQAERADEIMARGEPIGALHGLPVAVKDLFPTKGMRTTFGAPLYADHVPDHDHIVVERERQAGAIVLGKTNTPEFGAGGQTDNPVFGATRNPYDTQLSCGGSSGGGAVALATGMAALADGSDLGGSLRNPTGWCNVVGLRPSPGVVPSVPTPVVWDMASVPGPMARTVEDTALFLSVLAGPDPRSPISLPLVPSMFAVPLQRDFQGTRIAWSVDAGEFRIDAEIARVFEQQRSVFEELGCEVVDAAPSVAHVQELFHVLRGMRAAIRFRREVAEDRDLVKDTVVGDHDSGCALTGKEIRDAQWLRAELWIDVANFMRDFAFMVWPVNSIPPFAIDDEFSGKTGCKVDDNPVDWRGQMLAPVLGLPAISVPGGFTAAGLPCGLQITGRAQDDLGVLQIAHAYERKTQFWQQTPSIIEHRQGRKSR